MTDTKPIKSHTQSAADLDPFHLFRDVTRARIGLGRAGDAMPLDAVLDFQLSHARARDAVHGRVDFDAMADRLAPLPILRMRSMAPDRPRYLARPDLGRIPDPACLKGLPDGPYDIAFVIADGLSAAAVDHHAEAVLQASIKRLNAVIPNISAPNRTTFTVAPIILAEQARVAFGDIAADTLNARIVIVLIGERPGLSSPDSLGVYITWNPKPGRMDSERNCISNIHDNGLSAEEAAQKITWLVTEAHRRQLTGVALKEDSGGLLQG